MDITNLIYNLKIGSLKTKVGSAGSLTEAYSDPCQTSKMENFAKIVDGFQPLPIFAKRSIIDV